MNSYKKTLIATAASLALACGGAFAQSAGGGSAGASGSAQGQATQSRNQRGSANGSNGMNGTGVGTGGASGVNDMQGTHGGMQGTTKGCENLATSGPQRVAEPNRPVGTPTQGGANKGSTDWSDNPNCVNGQGRQPSSQGDHSQGHPDSSGG